MSVACTWNRFSRKNIYKQFVFPFWAQKTHFSILLGIWNRFLSAFVLRMMFFRFSLYFIHLIHSIFLFAIVYSPNGITKKLSNNNPQWKAAVVCAETLHVIFLVTWNISTIKWGTKTLNLQNEKNGKEIPKNHDTRATHSFAMSKPINCWAFEWKISNRRKNVAFFCRDQIGNKGMRIHHLFGTQ